MGPSEHPCIQVAYLNILTKNTKISDEVVLCPGFRIFSKGGKMGRITGIFSLGFFLAYLRADPCLPAFVFVHFFAYLCTFPCLPVYRSLPAACLCLCSLVFLSFFDCCLLRTFLGSLPAFVLSLPDFLPFLACHCTCAFPITTFFVPVFACLPVCLSWPAFEPLFPCHCL
jgi:hypothetical protein